MTNYLLAFGASFLFVGLKSIQQLNVYHKAYKWIIATSMFMAVTEVFIVATVAKNGWGWLVIAVGLGGGLGSMLATYLHSKFIQGEK